MNGTWKKIAFAVAGLLLSVMSASGGYVFRTLSAKVEENKVKFEAHAANQQLDDLRQIDRLARIETVLENILDELKKE